MYKKLEWDSRFFGFEIVQIGRDKTNVECLRKSVSQIKKSENKLLYWFIEPESEELNKLAIDNGAVLVDEKITFSFRGSMENSYVMPSEIIEYPYKEAGEQIIKLGLQCGVYSRFRLDKKFPCGSFEGLYSEWVYRSVNHDFADVVYVYKDADFEGLITLAERNGVGHIVLIGVDEKSRGKRIGQKLIDAAKVYFSAKGIFHIDVITQRSNNRACSFYEKNGFQQSDLVNVYHIWN